MKSRLMNEEFLSERVKERGKKDVFTCIWKFNVFLMSLMTNYFTTAFVDVLFNLVKTFLSLIFL